MDSAVSLFYIIVVFICPVLGLLLGAILPPCIWPHEKALLIGLNIGGFIFYAPGAMMVAVLMCAEPKAMGDGDILEGILLASALYLVIVAFSRMLAHHIRA